MKNIIKKSISILLVILMLTAFLPIAGINMDLPAHAAAAAVRVVDEGTFGVADEFTWHLYTDGTLELSGEGDLPNVVNQSVPWSLYKEHITGVVLREGITSIADSMFGYCYGIKSVLLPQSLKKIGDFAFECCFALENVTFPDSLEEIGEAAFSGCYSLKELAFPKSLKRIKDGAFYSLFDLEKLIWPGTADTVVECGAFGLLTGLKELIIPADAVDYFNVEDDSFSAGASALWFLLRTSFSIEKIINYSDTITASDKMVSFDTYASAKKASVLSELSVKCGLYAVTMSDDYFYNNILAGKIAKCANKEYGYNIVSLEAAIFLKRYMILSDDDRESSGASPFVKIYCNSGSAEQSLCDGKGRLYYLNDDAGYQPTSGSFADGGSWEVDIAAKTLKIYLTENKTTYFNYAPAYSLFKDDIEHVEIIPASESVTEMELAYHMFTGLEKLEELTVPEGVTDISFGAFYDSGIKHLSLPSTAKIDNMNGIFTGTTPIEEITVADGNETLFSYKGALYTKDGMLVKMPEAAYDGTLHESATKIGTYAYENYRTVTRIEIPDCVTYADREMIYDCPAVTDIKLGAGLNSDACFYDGMFLFAAKCCNLQNIDVSEDNTGYSSVDGVLCDKSGTYLARYPMGRTKAVFPDGIKCIGNLSFYLCEISEVLIPESVEIIDYHAFDRCLQLERVRFAENSRLKRIHQSAFRETSLEYIFIPERAENTPDGDVYVEPGFCYQDIVGNIVIEDNEVDISNWWLSETVKIHCNPESAAWKYAEENGINHVRIYDCSDGHEWINCLSEDEPPYATCTNSGKITRFCCYCSAEEEVVIPAVGHDFVEKRHVEPTCASDGWHIEVCLHCGAFTCDDIPALEHSFVEEDVPATCTEGGYTKRTCTVCSYVERVNETMPIGHRYADEITPATCTEGGYTKHTCTVCSYVMTDSETEPTGHNYVDTVIPAACTESGCTVHTCKVCNYTFSDSEVKPLGHSDKNGDGKCDICGESVDVPVQSCSHICHSTNKFSQFFWRIIRFFNKLFKINEFCECGKKHW